MVMGLLSTVDINENVWINPLTVAKKYRAEAFKSNLKAQISLMVLSLITTVCLSLAAIYAPPLVPAVMIAMGATSKEIHRNFYLKYKEENFKFSEFAQHMQGIAEKINTYQKTNLKGSDYYNKLFEFGINAKDIKHQESLKTMDLDKGAFYPLKNLIGRIEYWSEVANQYKIEIQKIDKKIQRKAKLLYQPGISIDKHRAVKWKWLLLNIEKHKLEEEKFLPAKLAAAYNLHVAADVSDKREYIAFGVPEPSSYLDSLTFKDPLNQPYYIFTPNTTLRQPLSKQWMLEASIQKIAKTIFGGHAILVA